MRFVRLCRAAVLAGAAATSAHAAQVEDLATAALAYNCYTCHGTGGASPGEVPSIAHKSAAYIERKLREYKNDAPASGIMNRIARALSDEEITRIAGFIHADGAR